MSFEIKGDIKKLSIKEGDVIVVLFKDHRLFKVLMEMDNNPIANNIKKALGKETKILILPPGIEIETLTKEQIEKRSI